MKTAELKKIRTYIDNLERHVNKYYLDGSSEHLGLSEDSISKVFRDIDAILGKVINSNDKVAYRHDNYGQLLIEVPKHSPNSGMQGVGLL